MNALLDPEIGELLDSADFVKRLDLAESASETLARFAAGLRWETIPPEVQARARHLLIDVIGIGLAGAAQPGFKALAEGLAACGTTPGTTLFGGAARLSPPNAALFNGMAAHALDWDDTHMATINHASGVIVPTALAVGELRGASVPEILTAMVAGYETMLRIGLGAGPLDWWAQGLHGTSVQGVFGAAVTAGKLWGLDARGLAQAIGLAASQASGLQQYASPGEVNDAKRFHSGWPALCGVTAAALAAGGLTAPRQVLEGVRSLYKTHLGRAARFPAAITADLGTRWETLRISVKVFPCCQGFQAPLEVARRLRSRLGAARLDEIREIHIAVTPGQRTLVEPVQAKRRPATHTSAVIAMPFCLGKMLAHGAIDLSDFSAEGLLDPAALALADRVVARVDAGLPARSDGAEITLLLDSGETLTESVACYEGGPDLPLSEAGFRAKFLSAAAAAVGRPQAETLAADLFAPGPLTTSILFKAMRG